MAGTVAILPNRARKLIAIRCEGSPGPGLGWNLEAEFRPHERGFSFWVYRESLAEDWPRWRKVCESEAPLTWRTACAFLARSRTLHAYGDLWSDVAVEGMPWWGTVIARCLFIVDEEAWCDFRSIGRLLLGFSDLEIRDVLKEAPIPPDADSDEDSDALATLDTIALAAKELRLTGGTLSELKGAVGLPREATLAAVAAALEQALISKRVRKLSSCRPKCEQAADAEETRKTQGLWETLSAGPLPAAPAERVALVRLWLLTPDKPRGGGPVGAIRESSSSWPVLSWLIGKGDETAATLEILQRSDPALAKQLVDAAMRYGKGASRNFEVPFPYSGWAMNTMGKAIMRGQVNAALRVQEAADRLGILADEALRIGELPYLDNCVVWPGMPTGPHERFSDICL
jgi:hypothetical protein